jgi:thioester reductase-like protein
VVLRRLSEAVADGDPIEAVILGSAVNNDGSAKVGYTAPSVDGEAEVIAMAHAAAGVDPATIRYVETHGSGTPLGDPIEVAALAEAFAAGGAGTGFCALGSVKTNFGHLEAAAGVAGLIKAILAVRHGEIPPSLHFERPNPKIDFAASPFFVATRRQPWPAEATPRRAGVSSFGIGGTNAHVVLEEGPPPEEPDPGRPWQLLLLSARTPSALEAATDRLAEHLERHPEEPLADVAWTLAVGRRAFEHRRALVAGTAHEAARALAERDPRLLLSSAGEPGRRPLVFLFPGLGDHYPGMGRGLYEGEPAFREGLDECAELAAGPLGADLRELLFRQAERESAGPAADLRRLAGRGEPPRSAGEGPLGRVELLQPALFALEVALARMWRAWGLEPEALLGFSLGEWVAATVAGVVSLPDAVEAVVERSRLLAAEPPGAMLAVPLAAGDLAASLSEELWVAAEAGPRTTVVGGSEEAVEALAAKLAAAEVPWRRLAAARAFHTPRVSAAASPLAERLRRIELRPPRIPFVSNLTGTWIEPAAAIDPEYWAEHLRRPVRFGEGLATLFAEPTRVYLEVGPGQGLSAFLLQHPGCPAEVVAVPSLPPAGQYHPEGAFVRRALGSLWLAGLAPDWRAIATGERRRRLLLPTYPFERQRFWVDPPRPEAVAPAEAAPAIAPAPTPAPAPEPATRDLETYRRPNLRNPYVAPSSRLEETLARAWREVLGIGRVGVHDDFFALGGNSLVAPRLLLRLSEAVGLALPLDALFAAPTVAELAALVERAGREGFEAALPAREPLDLAAEVALDPEIRPAAGLVPATGPPRAVFLTGASGFLGAFLAAELLASTEASIVCLVRASGPAEAAERLRRNLEARGVWRPEAAGRLRAVAGDLSQPRFGLDRATFDRLAAEVEAVYHAGAWVNFTYPYRVLKPANVLGTVEALRLAAGGRTKPLHFVSSVAVFAPGSLAAGRVAREDSALPATAGLFSGYAESKWAAEKLVGLARQRGIPATIHRPGVVGGHSETGAGNSRDLVWNVIKGSIELGAAMRGMGMLDVAPVDYVARAIVHLSRDPDSLSGAFHYPNPEPLAWDEVFDAVAGLGYELRRLEPRRWRDELLAASRAGRPNALEPFLPMLREDPREAVGEETAQVRYNGSRTAAALAGTGIGCPAVTRTLIATYVRAFVASGFLDPPPAAPALAAAAGLEAGAGRGAEAPGDAHA